MRITAAAIWTAGAVALLVGMTVVRPAEAASPTRGAAVSASAVPTDLSAQSRRRRAPTRLRVYRDYDYPGPNALRQCEAHYVQEFRQAGTVIVPRMDCRWVRG